MMGPSWLLGAFAAVMLAVAAVSAGRLVAARVSGQLADPDIDGTYILMGIAMAGMLTPSLSTLPSAVWAAVFAATTVWFGWRVARSARSQDFRTMANDHHVPHLIHSAAMVYMFVAVGAATATAGPAMGGMGGMSGMVIRVPTLALVFALLLLGYAAWDLDRLSNPATAGWRAVASAPAPLPRHASTPASQRVTVDVAMAAAGTTALISDHGQAPDESLHAPGPAGPAVPAASADPAEPSGPAVVPGPGAAAAQPVVRALLAPGLASCCRVAMGITMAYMLIILI